MFRGSTFDKLLDEATSNYKLDINWDAVLKITELIRQGDVGPKEAVKKIIKKISNTNQHTAYYALCVLESCVKNCGSLIQGEISTKDFMEQYKEIIEKCSHENVKTKALDLLQSWAYAFRKIPEYRPVNDTMNIMKHKGYKFPTFKESDAMFMADVAPVWKEGNRCNRCRSEFTVRLRKHHCRNCGEVFCYQCTPHNSTIPKYGIEKEVRVCISCFEKLKNSTSSSIGNDFKTVSSQTKSKRRPHSKSRKSSPSWSRTMPKPTINAKRSGSEELPSEYVNSSLAQQSQNASNKKTEEELNEEEDLQLALALSKSEHESKQRVSYSRPVTRTKSFSPPITHKTNPYENKTSPHENKTNPHETKANPHETKFFQYESDDPELARYLNRSYWDNRANTTDRPLEREVKRMVAAVSHTYDPVKNKNAENGLQSETEIDEFVNTLRSQVEIFVNRMKSNSSRGRSISNDTSVQTLFMNITAMHSKLLRYIEQQDDHRVYFEGLQDKLTQVKDARAALNALREEHRDRLRREAELAERQRQIQMAQKLEIMRQKKQEYLQYQRQLALQRIQDQEREMHLRQEQQKQQYRMTAAPFGAPPYMLPSQGGVSAFEPVTSMGMNMNHMPAPGVPYGPPSFPAQYAQGQPSAVPGPPQQAMGGPPTQATMMMNQPPMPPPNSYVPGGTAVPGPMPSPSAAHGQLGPGQQANANQYQVGPAPSNMLHAASHMKMNSQSQPVHIDPANAHAMMSGGHVHLDGNMHMMPAQPGARIEASNAHVMGPPHPGSMMQHPSMVRPMMPPSSSPLSSPSSSSEHSIIQHGPPPMPSAPSATSTPQPEEKEDVAELISFD